MRGMENKVWSTSECATGKVEVEQALRLSFLLFVVLGVPAVLEEFPIQENNPVSFQLLFLRTLGEFQFQAIVAMKITLKARNNCNQCNTVPS
ncbi:hypothetical protein Y1Q_0022841 [Alligator mississippiensis]|uniref:Uncharacterized protein n=1 Tax=Alligator mississippiensis TaxID=8496 RepID=A0A151N4P9_ALLMI|nr:hypothetical protein Y1Q_0022841 [Alligator mississippiensis]